MKCLYGSMRFGTRLWSKTLIYPSKWLRTGMDHYGYFNTTEQVSGIDHKQTRGFGDDGIVHSGASAASLCSLLIQRYTTKQRGLKHGGTRWRQMYGWAAHPEEFLPDVPQKWTRPSGSGRAALALQRCSLQMAKSLIVSILWTGLGNRCVGWGAPPRQSLSIRSQDKWMQITTTIFDPRLQPTLVGCVKMKGCVRVECFPATHVFQRGRGCSSEGKAVGVVVGREVEEMTTSRTICSPAGWGRPCADPRTWRRSRCCSCRWELLPLWRVWTHPASPSTPAGSPGCFSLTCTAMHAETQFKIKLTS